MVSSPQARTSLPLHSCHHPHRILVPTSQGPCTPCPRPQSKHPMSPPTIPTPLSQPRDFVLHPAILIPLPQTWYRIVPTSLSQPRDPVSPPAVLLFQGWLRACSQWSPEVGPM